MSETVNNVTETLKAIETQITENNNDKALELIEELEGKELSQAEQVLLNHFYGVVLFRLGNNNDSAAKFRKSLKVAEEIGDLAGQARAYEQIGSIYHNRSSFGDAYANYETALKIWERLGDIEGQGRGHRNLGNIFSDRDQTNNACREFDKSCEFFRQAGKPEELAPAIINRASLIYRSRGLQAAIASYKEGVENDKCRHYLVLNNYGFLLMLNGNTLEALSLFEDALTDINNKKIIDDDLALVRLNIGIANALLDRMPESEESLRIASDILSKFPDARAVELLLQANTDYLNKDFLPFVIVDNGQKHSLAHLNLACVLARTGRLEEAEKEIEKGIDLDREAAYPYAAAGWIYLAAKNEKAAISAFETASRREPANEEYRKALALVNPYAGFKSGKNKVGPNDPCPCGSGRKFKKCHGANN